MKTLNILFSEPDVFSVLENWTYFKEHKCGIDFVKNHHLLGTCDCYKNHLNDREQSKANAIRIENPQLLQPSLDDLSKTKILKHGDIFHVEGIEYEMKPKNYQGFLSCCPKDSDCSCGEKVAILKLAKEKCKLCGGLGYIVKDEFQKQAPECPVCFPSEEAKIKLAKEEEPKEDKRRWPAIRMLVFQ